MDVLRLCEMEFSEEHDKFLLEAYFRSAQQTADNEWKYSIISCKQQFRLKFPGFEFNDVFERHVHRLANRFRTTGSVVKGHSTGRRTVLTNDTLEDIQNRLQASPHKSLKQLSAQTGLSKTTCWRGTKKLHMHPYKVSVVQELHPTDFARRVEFCHWFNNNLNNDDILDLTFFSDEAWFYLRGYVNTQNYRHWATENPHEFRESTLHPIKVGVFIAMSRRRIFGPIFFYDTINAERYREELLTPFIEQLFDDERQLGFFQQDGAAAHTANNTINFLQQFYNDRLISRNLWPPRSPDLTTLDFFMFGYLKNTVFQNRLHTLDELQEAITRAVNNITQETLQSVFNNLKRRINLCLQMNGEHFQHLL